MILGGCGLSFHLATESAPFVHATKATRHRDDPAQERPEHHSCKEREHHGHGRHLEHQEMKGDRLGVLCPKYHQDGRCQ